MHALLRDTSGRVEYKYPSRELSIITIDMEGMGTKHVLIANLPPELSNDTLSESLASFGKVLNLQAKMWSKAYRYLVSNWVRQVAMHSIRHLPSHLTIAGRNVLLS